MRLIELHSSNQYLLHISNRTPKLDSPCTSPDRMQTVTDRHMQQSDDMHVGGQSDISVCTWFQGACNMLRVAWQNIKCHDMLLAAEWHAVACNTVLCNDSVVFGKYPFVQCNSMLQCNVGMAVDRHRGKHVCDIIVSLFVITDTKIFLFLML